MPGDEIQKMEHDDKVKLYFQIGVVAKGVVSFFEIVAGVVAFFIPVSAITDFVVYLAQGELVDDPNSFLATHLMSLAHQFYYTSSVFIGVYLISRGTVKLTLIIALLRDKLWAYPSALTVLGIFVTFQMYEIVKKGVFILALLTALDLIVMWFIYREYQIVRTRVAE